MSSMDPTLQNHTKGEFDQHTFPGIDARMVFLPIGSRPQGRLKEALEHAGQQRAYPVEGGHIIKVPSFHVEEFADLFQVEENGWDHEHCDFCYASINTGQQCWTTREEHFEIACTVCYETLGGETAGPSAGGNTDAPRA